MSIQKRLSSIILDKCKYDELALVLADSYTKIYQETLKRKMMLLLIAIACFSATLSGTTATVVFSLLAGKIQDSAIAFVVIAGASAVAGSVLMFIRGRVKMPQVHCVSKLHWQYNSFPFDADTTCLCDTRKNDKRAEDLSIFELPITDIVSRLDQINSNVQTLEEEADYLQASASVRDDVEKVEQRTISSPFIAVDDPVYEELAMLYEKMETSKDSGMHVLPTAAQGLDNIEQIIEDCRIFGLDRAKYDDVLRTIHTTTANHTENAHQRIDICWPVSESYVATELATEIDDQVMELGGFETIQSATSEMFGTTLETLEEDIRPEVDRVNDERYLKIDMANERCNMQVQQIEMNRDMQVQTLEGQIDMLDSQKSGLEMQIDSYRSQISALENSKQSTMSAPYDASDQMKKQIDAQNDQIRKMNNGISQQVRAIEQQISGLRDQISSLNSQVSDLQSQISRVEEQANSQITATETMCDGEINVANGMAEAQIRELRKHIEELTMQEQHIEEFIRRNYERIEFNSTISNMITSASPPSKVIVDYRHQAISQIAGETKNLTDQLLAMLHKTTDMIARYRIKGGPFAQDGHAEYLLPVWYVLYTPAESKEQKWLVYTPTQLQINQDKNQPYTFTPLATLHSIFANEVEGSDAELVQAIRKATIAKIPQEITGQLKQLKDDKSLSGSTLRKILSSFMIGS